MRSYGRLENGVLMERVNSMSNKVVMGLKEIVDKRPQIDPLYQEYDKEYFVEHEEGIDLFAEVADKSVTEEMRDFAYWQINSQCELEIEKGIEFEGNQIALDAASLNEINTMEALVRYQSCDNVPVKLQNGSTLLLASDQFINMLLLTHEYVRACWQRRGELVEQIKSATNASQMRWDW